MELLETIKIVNGQALFLTFHTHRFNRTRKILFQARDELDLTNFIISPPSTGVYRCRIIYTKRVQNVEYLPYKARQFKQFQLVEANDLRYDFKYLHRKNINQLLRLQGTADDILIVKKGQITDTTIANVAFWDKDKWVTPNTPLLAGTTRERLLQQGQLIERPISLTDITSFSKMAVMNAMLGFMVVEPYKIMNY